ncbi:MAG: OmpA family protein [Bacteroidales bacterium]|nr:OmpA family protein [Bacteroidales bacterium]MCB9000142.1 OmpA family protein [Bacteroidales bacterium]MCB9013499.1 OmpA family protein [Bacteroidales bacterium]
MRILITGILVFLVWAAFSSWFYVCKIKPACEKPAETTITADTLSPSPIPPPEIQIPPPQAMMLYFDFDRAMVKASDDDDQKAKVLYDWLSAHPDANLTITGHTDSKGSDSYNQKLGLKRANSTREYLTKKGLPTEKMQVLSKGESEPVAENNSESGRAKNRRTEITIK